MCGRSRQKIRTRIAPERTAAQSGYSDIPGFDDSDMRPKNQRLPGLRPIDLATRHWHRVKWPRAIALAQKGDLGLLVRLLRSRDSADAEIPDHVRTNIADELEGKGDWVRPRGVKSRIKSRAGIIRTLYKVAMLVGESKQAALAKLAKDFNVSPETIRNVIQRRKTFREE